MPSATDAEFAKYNPRRLTVVQAVEEVAAAVARGETVDPLHELSRQVRGALLTCDDMRRGFAIARATCERLGLNPRSITRDGLRP